MTITLTLIPRASDLISSQGLVYLDVIIDENDYVLIPPLEGFVMNRVLGDYFETLLYKIFVSMDEHTTVGDMANLLQIDLSQVTGKQTNKKLLSHR